MCLGPLGSIAAIILGGIALWEIHSSQGKKSGKVFAWIGLLVGSFTTLAFTATIVMFLVSATSTARTVPAPRPLSLPTHMPPTAKPLPTATPSGGESMSREMNTTITQIGKVVVVDIGLSELSLDAALRKQRKAAKRKGQKLLLHTTSSRCRPCLGLSAALRDPKMQKALKGVRLVRIDTGDFHKELVELGIPVQFIPGFYILRSDLSPQDGIHGGEWDDDVASNIAPVLHAFVRGSYKRRRYPFASPSTPEPRGTIL